MHDISYIVLFCVISLKVTAGTVSQFPQSVDVSLGDTVTIYCHLNKVQSLCHTVAWLRVDPVNGETHTVQVPPQSTNQMQSSVCSVSVYNATEQDSGTYYCIVLDREQMYLGNGTTVIVKETVSMPSIEIMAFASSNAHDSTVTLQCVIERFAPSQVHAYWLIGSKWENGQIGSIWERNRENSVGKTVNHVTVSEKEWRSAGDCACVVKFGGQTFIKTLHYNDIQDLCYTLISTPRIVALVTVLFFFIVLLILTECY
ncbi:immunoglobulin kappa light chain [Misgurnus anguillicaudatus]|uniref:immunoglobulin kappa light chain n=1 Tax=Misgurnus anguillicaudatus TaxID=75329 RepID=UPI003CCFB232